MLRPQTMIVLTCLKTIIKFGATRRSALPFPSPWSCYGIECLFIYTIFCQSLCITGLLALLACGGGATDATPRSVTGGQVITSVVVEPSAATLDPGGTMTFSARVVGTGNPPQEVLWSCVAGVIEPSGLYTAPKANILDTITAKSARDHFVSGTATVTVGSPTPSVLVAPSVTTVAPTTGQQQFTATVVGIVEPRAPLW